ncbi:MAG TPA: hypothetical protein VD927_19100 [Chryseosolibacter sp.]|nr:hypothetical protein [Chryseosolibacter sp.]
MNARVRQYLFGLLFIGVGIYQAVINEYLETALYVLAGVSFVVNAITLEERFSSYKKPLVIISWLLIGATGILFLYLLQFKYL